MNDPGVVFRPEQLDPSVFLAPGARVVGDVTIGPRSSVWFNAVVRGDSDAIRIGAETNIQDGAILHADPGFPCTLGDRVTVGHLAIVHGALIEDDVLIGMRAVVMNGARVGRGSLIGAGAVVTEGVEIPPGSLVVGMPAVVKRLVHEREQRRVAHAAAHYVHNAERFAKVHGRGWED